MAVLDDVVIVAPDVAPDMITTDDIKSAVARQLWAWLYAHQNDHVISRKILFWTVSVHIRDLFPLFEKIIGNPDGF